MNSVKNKANPQGPRPFSEIETEFQQLSAKAANSQYTVYVHTKELEQINKRLVEVNTEASVRRKLDADIQADLDKAKSGAV